MHKHHTDVSSIITNSLFSIIAIAISVVATPIAQAQSTDGRVKVEYEPAQTPLYQSVSEALRRDQSFEATAESLSQFFVLPRDITLSFQECRTNVTHYNAAESLIVLCYELLESFRQDFESLESVTVEESPYWAISVGQFVFLHEIGHALIHDWNLPVLGREEDAADQFATVVLSLSGRDSLRLAWQTALQLLIASRNQPDQPLAWGEHSSPLQRFYNIACLSYGSDPTEYDDLSETIMPISQRDRCVVQSQQIARSWIQLIQPYIRL